jgi:hypothetical protein
VTILGPTEGALQECRVFWARQLNSSTYRDPAEDEGMKATLEKSAVIAYVTLCYVMLCYVMLWYVML